VKVAASSSSCIMEYVLPTAARRRSLPRFAWGLSNDRAFQRDPFPGHIILPSLLTAYQVKENGENLTSSQEWCERKAEKSFLSSQPSLAFRQRRHLSPPRLCAPSGGGMLNFKEVRAAGALEICRPEFALREANVVCSTHAKVSPLDIEGRGEIYVSKMCARSHRFSNGNGERERVSSTYYDEKRMSQRVL